MIACAQTGSGKTAAFLLPIINRLIDRPRRTTKALVLAPTRELAAQILEDLNALSVHTPVTGAAVYGGVGMGPQEHAFRSGVDIMIATPGRLIDHMRSTYARLNHIEHLVLDEADRMLDMGFLPEIRSIIAKLPAQRQTLFFSATMPPPIAALAGEMLRDPVSIQTAATGSAAVRHHASSLSCSHRTSRPRCIVDLLPPEDHDAGTDLHAHQASGEPACGLSRPGWHPGRAYSRKSIAIAADFSRWRGSRTERSRCSSQPTSQRAGIDVDELGHVVNFDVPQVPDDYVHRVGRTGRAEATGEAFTFVSPEEEDNLRAIERAIGKRLPRVTVPDFDYTARPGKRFEIPLAQRIAAIRALKRADRARAELNAARRAASARRAEGSAPESRTLRSFAA